MITTLNKAGHLQVDYCTLGNPSATVPYFNGKPFTQYLYSVWTCTYSWSVPLETG